MQPQTCPRVRAVLLLLPVLLLVGGCRSAEGPGDGVALAAPPRFVLVGDSTVTDDSGWGTGFSACVVGGATTVNAAASGRSSKSYRDEGLWDARVVSLGANDSDSAVAGPPTYVLIQFGHNGQPGKGPERETDPATTYREHLRRYITECRSMGMTPVLVTSMTRRRFDADGTIWTTLTPWADAVIAVGHETQTPVIDLHRISLHAFEALGPEGVLPMEPAADRRDWTHLNERGAAFIGPMVAAELERLLVELKPYIDAPPITPAYRDPIDRFRAE